MLTLRRRKGSCSPAAQECGRTPPFPSTHLQPVRRPHWNKLELTPTAQLLLSTSTVVPGVPWPPSSPSAQAPVLSDPGPDLISPVPPWVPPQLLSTSANCPALLAHAGHSQTLLPRHPPLHLERPEATGAAPSCPQLPRGASARPLLPVQAPPLGTGGCSPPVYFLRSPNTTYPVCLPPQTVSPGRAGVLSVLLTATFSASRTRPGTRRNSRKVGSKYERTPRPGLPMFTAVRGRGQDLDQGLISKG